MDDDEQEEGEIRPEVGNKDEPMADDKSNICGGAPDDDHHETKVLPKPTTVVGNIDSNVDKPEVAHATAGDLSEEEKSNLPVGGDNEEQINYENPIPKTIETIEITQTINVVNLIRTGKNTAHVEFTPKPRPKCTVDIGPIQNLVPLGCFGPFPNNPNSPFSFKTPAYTRNTNPKKNSKSGGPTTNKRKRIKSPNQSNKQLPPFI